MNFENANQSLCVICECPIADGGSYRCRQCRKVCEVFSTVRSPGNFLLVDVTSQCCGADVDMLKSITCCAACHEAFVGEMEREFGTHKKIVRMRTGEEFRVPVRDMIEVGVREEELDKYPRWES